MGATSVKALAEELGVTRDELLRLARRAEGRILHGDEGDFVTIEGAARLRTAVRRKQARQPMLRTNDRVRWISGVSGRTSEYVGTVKAAELPGDFRSLVLWDGQETSVWTDRDNLIKIKKDEI